MGEPVLWVGGWASGLACWRGELESLYSGRPHAFLDAHEVLADPGRLSRAAAELPPEGVLVAWSLGSLLLHARLAAGEAFNCRLLSLSPIFDFCCAGGPWPREAVFRMIRKLPKARADVLGEFWKLAKGNTSVTPSMESEWLDQSHGYPLDALLDGLETLVEVRVDRGDTVFSPSGDGIRFLASPFDPVASMPEGTGWGTNWTRFPKGHLPFLEYHEILRPMLEARP